MDYKKYVNRESDLFDTSPASFSSTTPAQPPLKSAPS